MRWLFAARERLRSLVQGDRLDEEMDEEIRFHIEMEVEKNRRAGMSPEEAWRRAHVAFGGVERVRAEVREVRGLGWIEVGWNDLRYALRVLRLNPVFTTTLVLTLALGIAASVVMFGIVDALLLRPLPYHEPEQLVEIHAEAPGAGVIPFVSWEAAEVWREETGLFEEVMNHRRASLLFTGGGEPRTLTVEGVTPNFEEVLGVRPMLGRGFEREDADPAAPPVVMLDHAFWQSAFGGDPGVVERTVELEGEPHRIVGVMPRGFKFPLYATTELWLPIRSDGTFRGGSAGGTSMLARLRGEPIEHAQARADGLAAALAEARPRAGGWAIQLRSLAASRAPDPQLRQGVRFLGGAVLLLLLLAVVNATTLLLVRAWARARELAVRVAMGASRRRLMGQLLTESVVFALASGVVAAGLAWVGLRAIRGIVPGSITFFAPHAVEMQWRVLAFTFGVTVVAGVLIGMLPALRATRIGTAAAEAGLTPYAARTPRGSRLRQLLVASEVTLSVVLTIGAGLLINSFVRLVRVDPGFRTENVAIMRLNLSEAGYPSPEARAAFLRRLEQRLEALPGVEAVAVNGAVPPAGGMMFGVRLEAEGAPPHSAGQPLLLPTASVPPDFFTVLDVPVVAGRTFTPQDAGTDNVIINRELARFLWGDAPPVGRRFRTAPESPWLTVAGVVGELRMTGPDDRQGRFSLLYPMEIPTAPSFVPLAIRTRGDPRPLLHSLRAAVHELDPRQPVEELRPATELYAATIDMPRFLLVLTVILSGIALVLAAIGVYGVLASAVVQRRRELGIRIALGAPPARVSWGVLREGLGLAAAGTVAGVAVAAVLARLVQGLLYGVEPRDPATIAAVGLVSVVTAAMACYWPARRAVRIDPLEVLRAE